MNKHSLIAAWAEIKNSVSLEGGSESSGGAVKARVFTVCHCDCHQATTVLGNLSSASLSLLTHECVSSTPQRVASSPLDTDKRISFIRGGNCN